MNLAGLSDSWLILILVCGPLLGVLIVFLVRIAKSPGRSAAFPGFSIFIGKLDRDTTRVSLTIGGHTIDFEAQVESGDRIRVQVPPDTPQQTLNEVVPKLTHGLRKLRYNFTIDHAGRVSESDTDSRTG